MFWRTSGIRITLTIMALFVLVSALVVSAIYWQTRDILTNRNIASVIAETRALSELAVRDGATTLLATLRSRRARSPGMIYGLANSEGQTVWLGGVSNWPDALARDNKTGVFSFRRQQADGATGPGPEAAGTPHLAIGATLRLPDGTRLLVARDVTEQRDLASAIRDWFLIGMALLALVAVAAAWAINHLLMSRLNAMTRTADGIMNGDLSRRIPLSTHDDEFDALAAHLNRMLERIDSLMQGLREVSDNIAHDLKTPLNRLRIRAEEALRDPRGDAACREGLETTLHEADELIRTFNALLRVARLEAGTLGDNLETFDVAALIQDLAEFYEPVAEEASASLNVIAEGPLHLSADRQLISQALTNLIENALKYGLDDTLPAARRVIDIGVRQIKNGAELWVGDHGLGMRQADYGRVLKRFVRLDAARSKPGTGLGLSLVAAVVRQHGGSIELTDNEPGLKVVLHLPVERLAERVIASRDDLAGVAVTAPSAPASRKTTTAEI
ncbi:MAG: ATP-binding protein [Hyphomicrobiaceae bacterium]